MTAGSLLDVDWAAVGDLLAEVQHDDALRHLHDQAHVVLDEHDATPSAWIRRMSIEQLGLLAVVEPGRRLVEQQQRGWDARARAISTRRCSP